jgi:sulfur-oxidizing protein SoxZ
MSKIKPRVKVPRKAKAGEAVTIKTLISHSMESGQRKDKKTGDLIPRKIINKFVASYNGETVFSADLEPAVAANPYIQFSVKLSEPGTMRFEWTDDDGSTYDVEKKIKVA